MPSKYGAIAGTIIAIALSLYVAAYTLPDAFVALTCQTSWAGAPTAVITLGTTVLAIVVIVAIMIKFMPEEIKGRIGF